MSEDVGNNKQENLLNKDKIFNFLKDGARKTFSLDTDSILVSKRIKQRSADLFHNFIDVIMIFFNAFAIIFYYFVGMFKVAKDIPHAWSRAAHNNFRLGFEELKKNNLVDARIRFLLSNMFYNKSATTKYYIAYVYYKQGNFIKSLKYLKSSLSIDNTDQRAIELFKTIENELNNDGIDF